MVDSTDETIRRQTLDELALAAHNAVQRGDLIAAMLLYGVASILAARDPLSFDRLERVVVSYSTRMIADHQSRTS
jgi:hypothetical protein